MSTAASATRLRCGPALARHLLHPPQLAAAASTAGVRRPLVMGAARVPQQQQQQSVGAVRHSTIWRKVQEGIQGKQAEKEEEQFQAELQRLASISKYDLKAFKDAMDNAEKGSWFSWVNKMPGVRSMPEVQMGERYKKILGALTEAELCRPALIQSRAKLRIAQETGETIQEINLLLTLYENSVALHKWVRRRVADGKELPRNRAECQVLMMADPAGISVSSFQQKQQKRAKRRGGRLPF